MPAGIGRSKIVGEKIGEKMDSFAFKEEEALADIWAFSTLTPVFQQFRLRHLRRHLQRRRHHHLLVPTYLGGRTKMATRATLMTTITTAHLMDKRAVVGTQSHGVSLKIGMTAMVTLPWMLAALVVVVLRGTPLFEA